MLKINRTYFLRFETYIFHERLKTISTDKGQNVCGLSCFTFGKGRRSFSTMHEIRWFLIAGTPNRASIGTFHLESRQHMQWQMHRSRSPLRFFIRYK